MIFFAYMFIVACMFTMLLQAPALVLAYHGGEISLSLDSAEFTALGEEGNRVDVSINYIVNDTSFISQDQKINSVMKVYLPNGTLIKTSSSPEGFSLNQTGTAHHATTIPNSTLQNVFAVVQYTDLAKTLPISNPLQMALNLTQSPSVTEHEIAALQD